MLGEEWRLELEETKDILSSLNKEGIKTVAFKAEMDSEAGAKHARNLLETKGVDAVCYNHLKDSKSFGTDDNEITFITETKEQALGRSDKLTLALKILAAAKELSA